VLSTGPINIVLPDGDVELKAEVDRIIKELQAEGFIDQLAVKYFSD
jgi:ABC-type amino acid transport substrate-binding protein